MREDILKNLYEKMIPIILKDCPEYEQEEMKRGYWEYINKIHDDVLDYDMPVDVMVDVCLEIEKEKWEGKDIVSKEFLFLKDEKYEQLIYLSNVGFKNAQIRLFNELNNENNPLSITHDEAIKNIELMEDYVKFVRPYHEAVAANALSEGILDYQYAFGYINDTSLRIGRMH